MPSHRFLAAATIASPGGWELWVGIGSGWTNACYQAVDCGVGVGSIQANTLLLSLPHQQLPTTTPPRPSNTRAPIQRAEALAHAQTVVPTHHWLLAVKVVAQAALLPAAAAIAGVSKFFWIARCASVFAIAARLEASRLSPCP